ncbi:MAG: hypothetical protein IT530_17975 [Burkholderiales bacterium]|nr:hypothetical protein [Burkholderiales bacterium]
MPAQRVDFVATEPKPVHKRIVIPMEGRESNVRSEDMAYIAACNPENIAALLAEIDRLRAAVQHESDCVEAAKAEVEALRAALHTCLWAMRQPLDGWKGDCERKAMDIARAALAAKE